MAGFLDIVYSRGILVMMLYIHGNPYRMLSVIGEGRDIHLITKYIEAIFFFALKPNKTKTNATTLFIGVVASVFYTNNRAK
jgi:hypothetical protein